MALALAGNSRHAWAEPGFLISAPNRSKEAFFSGPAALLGQHVAMTGRRGVKLGRPDFGLALVPFEGLAGRQGFNA